MRPAAATLATAFLLPALSGCAVLDTVTGPEYASVAKAQVAGSFSPLNAPAREEVVTFEVTPGSTDLAILLRVTFHTPVVPAPPPVQGRAEASIRDPAGAGESFEWDASGERDFSLRSPRTGAWSVRLSATGEGTYEIRATATEPVPR
ncbi:MAG TPA: hypothetical protein VM681_08490 [Candidatus Thermoplasmatota archaeon]|nr:hypothetical protein [Candidatus Thermoplasmatota archaeon]